MAFSQNTLKKIKRLLKGRLLEIFNPKRRQRHAKVNFGDDGKRETSNRSQPFAVNAMLKVSIDGKAGMQLYGILVKMTCTKKTQPPPSQTKSTHVGTCTAVHTLLEFQAFQTTELDHSLVT